MHDRKNVREKHGLEWQPRLLRPGEEEALLRLLLAAFGTWPKAEINVEPIEHLRWKLEAAPEPQRAVVVEQDGVFIAGVLLSARPLLLRGRSLVGNMGGDLAVLPAFQNKGVFTAMQPFLHDVHAQIGDFSYGYRSEHGAVLRATRAMKRGVFGNRLSVLVATSQRAASPDDVPWTLRTVDRFDDRVDALWEQAAPQFDFICARTSAFLNYRYCDRRAGDFSALIAEQDSSLLGYIVERVSHGRGYIADLLAAPGRLDVVVSLVSQALADLRMSGVDRIECWIPARHDYVRALLDLGFELNRTLDLTYQPFRTTEPELSFLRSAQTTVHFTAGDTDLV